MGSGDSFLIWALGVVQPSVLHSQTEIESAFSHYWLTIMPACMCVLYAYLSILNDSSVRPTDYYIAEYRCRDRFQNSF